MFQVRVRLTFCHRTPAALAKQLACVVRHRGRAELGADLLELVEAFEVVVLDRRCTLGEIAERVAVKDELQRMKANSERLLWQDGLPASIAASVTPYREQLDSLFCGATAGLEMDKSARRAILVALY